MTQYWFVRLGREGEYVEETKRGDYIAIGWDGPGSLEKVVDGDVLENHDEKR